MDNVDAILKAAIRSLSQHSVVIDRDSWLAEAEQAEKAGSVVCGLLHVGVR
jgi:hypothetical protein